MKQSSFTWCSTQNKAWQSALSNIVRKVIHYNDHTFPLLVLSRTWATMIRDTLDLAVGLFMKTIAAGDLD